MAQRYLVIADDLTGGADAGAQFAENGFSTFLISFEESHPIDFLKYDCQDILVINTDSRALKPEKAFHLVSSLLKGYDPNLYPVIYKKIDSTLRGNIGYEIDALIQETNPSVCFVAPSYPEQRRTVVDGILRVGGDPTASMEISRDVQESHVCRLLEHQSRNHIGWIGLKDVASGAGELRKRVDEERAQGTPILVFDAVSRRDLMNIADLAFQLERNPLLVGSAGLAKEVAQRLRSSKSAHDLFTHDGSRLFKHVFIISGSASSVTHRQLKQLEGRNVEEFILPLPWLTTKTIPETEKKEFSNRVADALSKKHTILRSPLEFLPADLTGSPIHLKIAETLAGLALSAMQESEMNSYELALILTGGETAMTVVRLLQAEGIAIERELLEGIMRGYLVGGKWDHLTVVTKAGAFGEENDLKNVLEILERGNSK